MVRFLTFVGFVCLVVTATRMRVDAVTGCGVLAWFLAGLCILIQFAAQRHASKGPTS